MHLKEKQNLEQKLHQERKVHSSLAKLNDFRESYNEGVIDEIRGLYPRDEEEDSVSD